MSTHAIDVTGDRQIGSPYYPEVDVQVFLKFTGKAHIYVDGVLIQTGVNSLSSFVVPAGKSFLIASDRDDPLHISKWIEMELGEN